MFNEGLTLFVEGNNLGKIEAAVEAKPPDRNKDENKKPNPSFLKDFTLKRPNRPINVMSGNTQSQGVSKKL